METKTEKNSDKEMKETLDKIQYIFHKKKFIMETKTEKNSDKEMKETLDKIFMFKLAYSPVNIMKTSQLYMIIGRLKVICYILQQ